MEDTKNVIGSLVDETMVQETGHIVIRVNKGGETYSVIVLDDRGIKFEILLQKEYSSR